jgi:hypothetical protein
MRRLVRTWHPNSGPIRDQSGAVMFLHPTGIDTERKQIEAALRESEQRLR